MDILLYIQLFIENENQRNIFKNSGILLSYDMLRQKVLFSKNAILKLFEW